MEECITCTPTDPAIHPPSPREMDGRFGYQDMQESTVESGWQTLDSQLNSSMGGQGDWCRLNKYLCYLWDLSKKMTLEDRRVCMA